MITFHNFVLDRSVAFHIQEVGSVSQPVALRVQEKNITFRH